MNSNENGNNNGGEGFLRGILKGTFSDDELNSMSNFLGGLQTKRRIGQAQRDAAREAAIRREPIEEAVANVKVVPERREEQGSSCCVGECITVPFKIAGEHKRVVIPCCGTTAAIGALATYGGIRLIEAASPYFSHLPHLIP